MLGTTCLTWATMSWFIICRHFYPPSFLMFSSVFLHFFCSGSAAKVVAAGLVSLGGGVGGTVLYAKWDPKFRSTVEKNVPYTDWLFGVALGPASYLDSTPIRKPVRIPFLHSLFESNHIMLTQEWRDFVSSCGINIQLNSVKFHL